jgi:putative DNA primase/helicase
MIAQNHLDMLAASGITVEHAEARGYETITDRSRLQQLGITPRHQRVPGLLVPGRRKDGSIPGYQYRADSPAPSTNAKSPAKYVSPSGQSNYIDVPPGAARMLDDPKAPLFITEGAKKADCGVLAGLCCVSINGVWGWRGTNKSEGNTALGDWNDIALNDRRIILAFDGDVARKKPVQQALAKLANYLASRGARVEYLHLPDTDDKTGLDDFLMDGHGVDDLWNLVTPNQPEITGSSAESTDSRCRPNQYGISGAEHASGAAFFDRDGLLALNLANDVMRSVTCGFGVTDQRLYIYDSGVWRPDDGRIESAIAARLGNRYRNSHFRNALDLIRHSPNTARITCDPLPQYINVANGMIDWKTGKLLPHSPDYRSTVQLPVDYDRRAQCPRFERYLADVLPLDCYTPKGDSRGFIWELIGYTLYSGNPLHIAVLLYGKGRNGKGTLIRVLRRLLGGHNCSTVGLHELVDNRFRAATLYGKLANVAGDLDSRWLDNTAMFKAITGGDAIQGEHKYGAVFDFTPWALPFYSANKAFGSADSSEGWVARWIVVPFPTSFIGRENRKLDSELTTDAEIRGILARAIKALPTLMERGRLPEPESVKQAKSMFILASDGVRNWLDEHCVLDPNAWTPRTTMHRNYRLDADGSGAKSLSAHNFYNRVEQINGIYLTTRNGVRGFSGVRLVDMRDRETEPDGEGAQGADSAGSPTPSRSHGDKGDKPAPSAPYDPSDNGRRSGFCRGCGTHFRVYGVHRADCTASRSVGMGNGTLNP